MSKTAVKKRKKRVTQKMIDEFIKNELKVEKWADHWMKEPSYVYLSKLDGSFVNLVGNSLEFKWMIRLGLTKLQSTHKEVKNMESAQVAWSTVEEKWYSWSHRAIFGFEVGSTCKKGDCHYVGSSLKEQEEDAINFWTDDSHNNTRCEGIIERDDEKYFDIKWEYTNDIPNKALRSKIGGVEHHITPLGKGEWTAKTMEDAKQMAIDFARGVS